MGEQLKTIGFAAAVCLVCSLLLAVVSSSLKEEQERNKINAVKVKVVSVFGEEVYNEKGRQVMSQEKVDEIFESRIQGIVLDSTGTLVEGKKVSDLTPEEINSRDKETKLKKYYPLYVYTNPEKNIKRYAIHTSGMGLWSVVKAYMAMESDMCTIAGITFYEHLETPGLGGLIEEDSFQDKFIGKKLVKEGKIQEFDIVKPGLPVDDTCVDGISGATMTCKGLTVFINRDFQIYNRYFEKQRK